jgi:hypothetical protein
MPSFSNWFFRREGKSLHDLEVEALVDQFRAVDKALEGPYGDNATLYRSTAKLVELAKFPDPQTFAKRVMSRFVDHCEQQRIRCPHLNIIIQMCGTIAGLYAAECLVDLPPNPGLYATSGETATLGAIRDMLIRLQRKAAQPTATLEVLSNCIMASLLAITERLPQIACENEVEEDGATSISLLDVLQDVGCVIESALRPFDSAGAKDLGLFRWLKDQLQENALAIAEHSGSKRPIFPSQLDRPPADIVSAYLKDTPLERIFSESRIFFSLPDETRYSGHWIIAPPGRGKTTLLHSMVLDDLSKDACVILMDSKGDLNEPFRSLRDIADRLIVIDPDPDNPIAINPLDIPKQDLSLAVSHLEYVFSSLLESKMTPLQTVLFRSILRALITAFPNPTLETFRDILTNGIGRYSEYIKKLPQDLQDFFLKEFNTKVYEDRRKEIIWRMRLLLENDAMRGMMLALRTRFNIAEAMDAGKVIIINNSKARLGDQGAEFFGRFFIAQVLAATQQRAGRKGADKKPVYFYIDECQNVISRDERIPTILDECRSQKVALILAHQRTEQITSPNVLSALCNCAIRYSNSDDEARFLSSKLRCAPELLQSLKRGQFAAFVRDLTPSAIILDVPCVDFSEYEQLTPQESAALTAKMREQYGVLSPAPSPPRSEQPSVAEKPKARDSSPPAESDADPNDPDTGSHTKESSSW